MTDDKKYKPAFPRDHRYNGHNGMTLHEHFAGLAMQGIVSSIDSEENYQRLKNLAQIDGLSVSEWIARDAHKQADAMLAVNSDTDAQAYLGEK